MPLPSIRYLPLFLVFLGNWVFQTFQQSLQFLQFLLFLLKFIHCSISYLRSQDSCCWTIDSRVVSAAQCFTSKPRQFKTMKWPKSRYLPTGSPKVIMEIDVKCQHLRNRITWLQCYSTSQSHMKKTTKTPRLQPFPRCLSCHPHCGQQSSFEESVSKPFLVAMSQCTSKKLLQIKWNKLISIETIWKNALEEFSYIYIYMCVYIYIYILLPYISILGRHTESRHPLQALFGASSSNPCPSSWSCFTWLRGNWPRSHRPKRSTAENDQLKRRWMPYFRSSLKTRGAGKKNENIFL